MPRSAPELLAELRELVAAHADAGVATPVEGLLLAKVERSMTPEYSLADPVLVVMAQGGKRLLLGDRVHEYRAGDFLIVTASLPVTGHFFDATPEAPALGMGLVLRPASSRSGSGCRRPGPCCWRGPTTSPASDISSATTARRSSAASTGGSSEHRRDRTPRVSARRPCRSPTAGFPDDAVSR
ncbi:AraC family transcriptional regulator [Pseudonocardia charpentierae]